MEILKEFMTGFIEAYLDEEVKEISMKQLDNKFKAGTHEAMNDPRPGNHVELIDTRSGKRIMYYVKEEVALDEAHLLGAGMTKAARSADVNQSDREYLEQRAFKNKWKAQNPGKEWPGYEKAGMPSKYRKNEEAILGERNDANKLKKDIYTAKLGNAADVTRSNYGAKELKPLSSRSRGEEGSQENRNSSLKNALMKMKRAGRAELKYGKDAGFISTLNDFGKNVRKEETNESSDYIKKALPVLKNQIEFHQDMLKDHDKKSIRGTKAYVNAHTTAANAHKEAIEKNKIAYAQLSNGTKDIEYYVKPAREFSNHAIEMTLKTANIKEEVELDEGKYVDRATDTINKRLGKSYTSTKEMPDDHKRAVHMLAKQYNKLDIERMKNEDVDQINEISKDALKAYKRNAIDRNKSDSDDYKAEVKYTMNKYGHNHSVRAKNLRDQLNKRNKNIALASRKIAATENIEE